jgi:hypothetical protein
LELLVADRAVAVCGGEGSDVLRPDRPIALEAREPFEQPEQLDGWRCRHGPPTRSPGPRRRGRRSPRWGTAAALDALVG